jgi:hypothetical protein
MIFIMIIEFFGIKAGKISHNVPAVSNVFADANKGFAKHHFRRKCDQGCKNVGEVWRENGAQRNDLAKTQPEPPAGGEA